MKTLFTMSLSLTTILGYSQIFEYVFTEIGRAEFSEVVVVGDKILMAANLSECPGAGIAVFDDSGQFLSETILEDYYSVAPSITYHEQSGHSYLLTFRNESEERYDVDQMIIYRIDQNGNVLDSHRDTVVASHYLTGKIVALDSVLIVQQKNEVYWYSLSFEALDTLYLPDEIREYEMVYADEDRLVFTSMVRNGETDYTYLIDQLIDYRIPLDSLNITGLSSFKKSLSLAGSNLFFYGVDNSLQKYPYGTDSIQESIVLPPNVIDIKVMQHEGRTLAILRLNTDEMQLVEIDFAMGIIHEPTWSITSEEHLHSVIQYPDHFYLISRLSITDGVYYPMIYSVLRKLHYGFNEVIEREDILIEEIDVLQAYERVESHVYPEGVYDQRVPAIVAIKVRNQSDRLIENFGYFSESVGGSFCSSGRNMKYLESSITPGATFQFYDTIYPY